MSHGRNRLPTRRSRRLAGLGPSSLSSNTDTMTSPRVGSIIMDEDDDLTQPSDLMPQRTVDDGASSSRATVEGRRSPYRRFSDPTFGEGGSAGTSAGRHSASSTTSPERASASTSGAGGASSGAGPSGSSVAQEEAGGSAGGRSFGRRGAVGGNRRAGQGTLLRAYTEQFGAVPVQGESFCRCPQQGQSRDLHCSCGEDDQVFEWNWDRQNKSVAAEVSDSEREVRFHVNYSSGTAAIRGSEPMIDRQYFWEVKMTTPVYGTDMMVGIGTANVDVDAYRYNFCSILGRDSESWGLSYYGKAQTRGVFTNVPGARFGQGSIIGVHLDTWLGRLLFYKNRKPLGTVFTGLRGKQLFPMVSSTAARTGMKLIKACSYSTSLQFLCCCALRKLVPPHLDVTTALYLPPGLHDFLVNNLDWLLRPSELGTGDWQQHFAAASGAKRDRHAADLDPSSSSDDESAAEALLAKRARLAPVVDGLSDFDEEPDRDTDLAQTSSLYGASAAAAADIAGRQNVSEDSSMPADSASSDALS